MSSCCNLCTSDIGPDDLAIAWLGDVAKGLEQARLDQLVKTPVKDVFAGLVGGVRLFRPPDDPGDFEKTGTCMPQDDIVIVGDRRRDELTILQTRKAASSARSFLQTS